MHPTSYNTNLTSKQPGRANSGLNLKPGEWETLFFFKTLQVLLTQIQVQSAVLYA